VTFVKTQQIATFASLAVKFLQQLSPITICFYVKLILDAWRSVRLEVLNLLIWDFGHIFFSITYVNQSDFFQGSGLFKLNHNQTQQTSEIRAQHSVLAADRLKELGFSFEKIVVNISRSRA
jgi:hypothetical protein